MKKIKLLTLLTACPIMAMSIVPISSCNQTQSYTVTFDSMGGTPVESTKVSSQSKLTQPANPTKEGYEFAGWYTDDKCEYRYNFDNLVYSDLHLYAKWNFDGVVKQNDWEKAIDRVIKCDENRNFILKSTFNWEESNKKTILIGAFWVDGTELKFCSNDKSIRMVDWYEFTHRQHNWSIMENNGLITINEDGIMPTNQSILQDILSPISDIKASFENATFDAQTKTYSVKQGDNTYTISFNSDKLISKFVGPECEFEFSQYGGAKILDDLTELIESVHDTHYSDPNSLTTNPFAKVFISNDFFTGMLSELVNFESSKELHFKVTDIKTSQTLVIAPENVKIWCDGKLIDSSQYYFSNDNKQLNIRSSAQLTKSNAIVIKIGAITSGSQYTGTIWID